MKKGLLVTVLVVGLVLFATGASAVAEAQELHTLWGVPFDVDAEEFSNVLLEATGIELVNVYREWYQSSKEQDLKLFGRPVVFEVFFNEDDNGYVSNYSAKFSGEGGGDILRRYAKGDEELASEAYIDATELYGEINRLIGDKYGEANFGTLQVGENAADMRSYDYPRQDGVLSSENLLSILADDGIVILDTGYNNAKLRLIRNYTSDEEYIMMMITYMPDNVELPNGRDSFAGEFGEHPTLSPDKKEEINLDI